MTNLKANVQFTCTEPGLTPDEKLMAIQNECQQTLYTDEDYDEAVYGKWISKYDLWMQIIDAMEEEYSTNLPPEYMEAGIDAWLREFVRLVHANAQCDVSQKELDEFDRLDNVMTIDNNPRDKRKFVVMNTPGYETKYHSLPWGWLSYELVRSNSPYQRKVIRNEEGNFEEIIDNDKPDWVLEMERNEERISKTKKMEHKTKILWKAIKDSRNEYKPLYDTVDRLKWYDIVKDRVSKLKKKADKSYAEYKYYSRAMDNVKELDAKAETKKLEAERDMILHLFVELQQKCPDELVDSVLREDIKAKYKKDWYERTRYYLVRLIRRAEVLQQEKAYEEEEATA